MKSLSFYSLLKIVLHGRSAGKILLATLLSFSFSIAVILCTFGLMDGFDHLLKTGLRHSSGDLLITSKKGFFKLEDDLQRVIKTSDPLAISSIIQTEAFALHEGVSKGVLVRGVDDRDFSEATGVKFALKEGEIVIGKELALALKVKPGDAIALTFGKGNESSDSLPSVRLFTVSQVIQHGIYQKDLRFVYIDREEIADILNVGSWINLLIVTYKDPIKPLVELEEIQAKQYEIRRQVPIQYFVRPFWSEYSYLIEAVKIEKLSITLILQLIVVVAVFNIIAFVIYIMEKKSQDFFFLRAIGLSLNQLVYFWFVTMTLLWFFACIGAYILAEFFNWSLANLSFLQIPGEIYVLSALQIKLDVKSYATVYILSLLWVLISGAIGYWRLKRRPIMQGLRQEFSA
jgi:ABC-type lipoprotein release transport system permease subunit